MKTTMPVLLLCMYLLAACAGSDDDDTADPGSGSADAGMEPEATCTTGCTSGGICRPGTAHDACGTGGDVCDPCGATETCEAGTCVPVDEPDPTGCNAATCDGCCDGDTCLSGTSDAACGDGGDACVDCGPRGICETGGDAQCAIDPVSRWDIRAISGSLPQNKTNGSTWDVGGGLPDGFAKARLGDSQLGSTPTKNDTLTPGWDDILASDVRAGDIPGLIVEVFDNDVAADDKIGGCYLYEFPFDAFDGPSQTIGCPDGAGWGMTLSIVPH
jgi:hypothetical protein